MTLLDIEYKGEKHSLYYHNDLIYTIAQETNTFFEEWLLSVLETQVKSFKCVVDIGSNVGNHAYFFKNICNADRVLCFEPLRSNIELLEKNGKGCEIYTVGLSSEAKPGYIEMIHPLDTNSGTGRVASSGIEITLETLDSYALDEVTFIKIDVEGHELEVIKGALETIERSKPDLLVETHLGVDILEVMDILPKGYSFERVTHETHYLLKHSYE